jgi:hypothetical protein
MKLSALLTDVLLMPGTEDAAMPMESVSWEEKV